MAFIFAVTYIIELYAILPEFVLGLDLTILLFYNLSVTVKQRTINGYSWEEVHYLLWKNMN